MPGTYRIQQHAPRRKDRTMTQEERDIRDELVNLDKKLGRIMVKVVGSLLTAALISVTGLILAGARFQERTEMVQESQKERIVSIERAMRSHRDVEVPALRHTIQELTVQLARSAEATDALQRELASTRSDVTRLSESLRRRPR